MFSLPALINDIAADAVVNVLCHLAASAVRLLKGSLAGDRLAPVLSSNHAGPTRSERIEGSLAKRRLAAADIAWIGLLAH